MYHYLLVTEFVVSIALLIMTLCLFIYDNISKPIQYIQFSLIAMFMLNAGYLFELQCTSINSAMTAVKMEYCGSVFISTFMLFVIVEYLRINLSKVIKVAMIVLDVIILLAALTYEHHNLMFKNVRFVESGLFSHIEYDAGIIRTIFSIYTIILGICMISLITYYYVHGKRGSKKVPLVFVVVVYLPIAAVIMHIAGIMNEVDFSPIVMGIAGVAIFIFLRRDMLFEVVNVAMNNVIDEMKDALVVTDSDMKLLEMNRSAKILFPELMNVEYGGDFVYEHSEILRMIINEKPKDVILIGDRYYSVRMSPITREDNIEGYYFHLSDRTDWKKRTDDLIQRSMETEELSNAKSTLLANTSHDIRTSINGIIGLNKLIISKTDNDEILEHSIEVERTSRYLLSLVNDILDEARIESGKMNIIDAEYDTVLMLNDLTGMAQTMCDEKLLAFDIDIDSNIPCKLIGDEVRIRQVLNNLISNAVKYTEKGKVSLAASVVEKDEFSVVIRFEVRDTGIGIKQEDVSRMLLPYERVDEKRNHKLEGTGLGMTIVLTLLDMMNSRLEIESVYSEGSCFSFDLKQDVADSNVIGEYSGKHNSSKDDKKGYAWSFKAPEAQILLVDDNKINQVVMKNILKLPEISVDIVSSGEECIEAVRKKAYNIILLDHMMSGMDGMETIRELKSMDDNMSIGAAVIALTGNAISGAESMYKTAGFDEYLCKPIDFDKLEKIIIRYLPNEVVIYNS